MWGIAAERKPDARGRILTQLGSLLTFFEVAHVVIAIGERYEHTVNHPNRRGSEGFLQTMSKRMIAITDGAGCDGADAQLQNWRFGFVKAVKTALSN